MKRPFDLTSILLIILAILSSLVVACGDITPTLSGQNNLTSGTVEVNPPVSTILNTGSTPTRLPITSAITPLLEPEQTPQSMGTGNLQKMIKVQPGISFNLRFGQVAQLEGQNVQLSLGQILEDSRCPTNVACAWSGQLIVSLNLLRDNKVIDSFTLNSQDGWRNKDKLTFGNYNVALSRAIPTPIYTNYGSGKSEIKSPKTEDYVLELVITPVENGTIPANKAVLGQRVPLKYGQTALYAGEGLSIKFATMTGDQRCPKTPNSVCSIAGEARINLIATKLGLSQPQTLSLSIPGLVDDTSQQLVGTNLPAYITSYEGYKIQLISLQPQRVSVEKSDTAAPESYICTLLVTKKSG